LKEEKNKNVVTTYCNAQQSKTKEAKNSFQLRNVANYQCLWKEKVNVGVRAIFADAKKQQFCDWTKSKEDLNSIKCNCDNFEPLYIHIYRKIKKKL